MEYPSLQLLSQTRPAQARNAVVFCCDDGFLPYALHAADQMYRNVSPDVADVMICYTGEKQEFPNFGRFRICHVGLDLGANTGWGTDQEVVRTVPVSSYLRIFLCDIFGGDYDRLLYADCDMFFEPECVDALFTLDMQGHCIAAVLDSALWKSEKKIAVEFKAAGVSTHSYFNAGLLLIDVAAWNENDTLEKLLTMITTQSEMLLNNDQSALNFVFLNNWLELSPVWNWQMHEHWPFFAPLISPRVIHFIGELKPWADTTQHWSPKFRESYRAFFLREGFPDLAPPRRPWRHRYKTFEYFKRMVKHAYWYKTIRRYVDRFPDIYQGQSVRPSAEKITAER